MINKYERYENGILVEAIAYTMEELIEIEAKKLAEVDEKRRIAYINEADPLFFKWQRGEATNQEWLDKVTEIKLRIPNPEV